MHRNRSHTQNQKSDLGDYCYYVHHETATSDADIPFRSDMRAAVPPVHPYIEYTIIIVTHNMQQAARVSDYTAFFLPGEVIEFGKTRQIVEMPEEKSTGDYVTGRFG